MRAAVIFFAVSATAGTTGGNNQEDAIVAESFTGSTLMPTKNGVTGWATFTPGEINRNPGDAMCNTEGAGETLSSFSGKSCTDQAQNGGASPTLIFHFANKNHAQSVALCQQKCENDNECTFFELRCASTGCWCNLEYCIPGGDQCTGGDCCKNWASESTDQWQVHVRPGIVTQKRVAKALAERTTAKWVQKAEAAKRRAHPKGYGWGSCAGNCGGYVWGGWCWCDVWCVYFNDCCTSFGNTYCAECVYGGPMYNYQWWWLNHQQWCANAGYTPGAPNPPPPPTGFPTAYPTASPTTKYPTAYPTLELQVQVGVDDAITHSESPQTINYPQFFGGSQSPVIVAGIPTFNGADFFAVRVKDVTQTGFTMFGQPASCGSPSSIQEKVPWMAVAPGRHHMADGTIIEAGTVTLGGANPSATVNFQGGQVNAGPPKVNSGPCTVVGNCVRSPNYPSNYGNGQSCSISNLHGPLEVPHFHTEYWYDKVWIDGTAYHGYNGPQGVTPQQNTMTWNSDWSVTKGGWEICNAAVIMSPPDIPGAVVLATIQTKNDAGSVHLRVNAKSDTGFTVLMHQDEGATGVHGDETIGWVAVSTGAGSLAGQSYTANNVQMPAVANDNIFHAVSPSATQHTPVVTSGACTVVGSCVRSPNYPNGNYGNSQSCQVSNMVGPLQVNHFQTEYWWDYLYVNGVGYHGSSGPQGVTPSDGALNWQSDGSVTNGGWEICNPSTEAIMPTAADCSFGSFSFTGSANSAVLRTNNGQYGIQEDKCHDTETAHGAESMSLLVIPGCTATTAHHHGISQVSGDPFVVDQNGAKVQFFLPLHQDVHLLTCNNMQIYGRAFGTGITNDHQQWFDKFRIAIDSKEAVVVQISKNATTINDDADVTSPNSKLEKDLTTLAVKVEGTPMTKTGAVGTETGGLIAVWHTDSAETVQFSLGNTVLQMKSAVAQKFTEKKNQVLYTHLDLRFVELKSSECNSGILAEIWGVSAMSQATAAMLQPPQ